MKLAGNDELKLLLLAGNTETGIYLTLGKGLLARLWGTAEKGHLVDSRQAY